MISFDDYAKLDALALAAGVRRKDFTARELADTAFARIEAVNGKLGAIVHVARDFADRQLAAGLPDGPFTGVPFLVKDLSVPFAGLPQTNGSRYFGGFVPDADSTLAQRQKAAGLVIVARTATPEFGLSPVTEPVTTGPCRNPWNLERQSGGSSGGSAAAVAAGVAPMGHATDGGGSVRMPASHCGLFGLKPSRARLPAGPLLGEAWNGLAVPHVVSRSVRDSAAMMDATMGPAPGDPYAAPETGPYLPLVARDPSPLRIAMTVQRPDGGEIHPEVRQGVEDAARLLQSLGHQVEEDRIDLDLDEFYRHFRLISGSNVAVACSARSKVLGREPGPEEIEPATRALLENARRASAEDLALALQWGHGLGRRLGAFFTRYDVMLTPVYTNPPLPIGSLSMQISDLDAYTRTLQPERPFTGMFNMSGGPAMSVPLHWTRDRLPVGIHFGADFGREDILFQLAGQLERAAPWAHRRPPL
jgi:Asp-tRNA(Asn)/Glu-tRNA(Gln) amidotransferase A subunit family amidase